MMIAIQCPPADELRALSTGRLADERSDELLEHIRGCEQCRSTLGTIADGEDSLIASLRSPESHTSYDSEPGYRVAMAKALGALALAGEAAAETVQDLLPKTIGEYEIVRPLGSGGMGSVFLARHTKLGREVAVKVLAGHRLGDSRMRERFDAEMRAVGKLSHPNIVTAHDAREVDGTAVLVTEYIDGFDLSQLVARTGPLPVADACGIVRQVAIALAYTSDQGFVHRDVKPSNIMLSRSGDVKLLDLGLARLQLEELDNNGMTGTGQTMGTADYMAPEQVTDSRSVDVRADIYSLGCTLFKLLCGSPPFADGKHATAFAKMTAHVSEPAPSLAQRLPEAPPALVHLIAVMLTKDPAKRPQSPQTVAEKLAPFAQGSDLKRLAARAGSLDPAPALPQATARPSSPTTLPLLRRNVPLWIAVAGGISGIVLGIVLGIMITIEYPDGTTVRLEAPAGSKVRLSDSARQESGSFPDPNAPGIDNPTSASETSPIPPLQFAILIEEKDLEQKAWQAAKSELMESHQPGPVVTDVGTWYPLSPAIIPADMLTEQMMGFNPLQVSMAMTRNGKRYVLAKNDPDGIIGWEQISGHLAVNAQVRGGNTQIELTFDSNLSAKLREFTEDHRQRQLAIILEGEIIAARPIQSVLNGNRAILTGNFTSREIGGLLAALEPSSEPIQENPRQNRTRVNLKVIGIAFHHFYDTYRKFPGSANVLEGARRQGDREKVEPFSWRVAILPFLGEQELYEQYRFDEPWDSEHNLTLLPKMPDVYRSPSRSGISLYGRREHQAGMEGRDMGMGPEEMGFGMEMGMMGMSMGMEDMGMRGSRRVGETHYQGFVGEHTALGVADGVSMPEILDGTSNTLLIVESRATVPWTKPQDLPFGKPEDAQQVLPFENTPLNFVTADGAVHEMDPIDWERLAKLITRDGGEPVRP